MNTHRLRYPPRTLGSAADVPWDQLIQAGTAVTTAVIEQQSAQKKGKRRKKKPAEEVEEAPAPVQVQAAGPPWGPIILVMGVVGAALIYASGGKKR